MSLTADQYTMEHSMMPENDKYLFENKQYLYIPDGQNGAYSSPQVTFECTSLTNSDRYVGLSEGFVTAPLVLGVTGNFTATNANAFALSLKNGYHQLINSIQVQISGNDIVTLSNLSNLKINYDIISTWSNDYQITMGQSVGFYGLDSSNSIGYYPPGTANQTGIGECNNIINSLAFTPSGGYLGTNQGNTGRLNRMLQSTSFDPAFNSSPSASLLTPLAYCNNLGKNYCATSNSPASSPTQINYYILATIPLKLIHDLFHHIPIVKGIYMKLVINFHTHCTVTIPTTIAGAYSAAYTSTTTNNCLPFMVSPINVNALTTAAYANGMNITPTAAVGSCVASLGIVKQYGTLSATPAGANGMMSQCRLYAPTYKLSRENESRYLQDMPQKTILYNDFMTFNSQCLNVLPGNQINPILTFGVSRLRGILIVPQISSVVHGGAPLLATTVQTIGSPLISPFSSAPGTCAPWSRVSNYNVFISGNAWYQQNINYGFEHFMNETRKQGAYGGGLELISSGLIGQSDYESGYGFIYTNLDRWANAALDNAPKSVQIQLTNVSAYNVDYFVYVIYQREVTISVSTGQLII